MMAVDRNGKEIVPIIVSEAEIGALNRFIAVFAPCEGAIAVTRGLADSF
jgi:hypothetical protein